MTKTDLEEPERIYIKKKNNAIKVEHVLLLATVASLNCNIEQNENCLKKIKMQHKCEVRKCENEAFKVSPECVSKYCIDHLNDMEQICIARRCNKNPHYGFNKKVLLCERHKHNYEITRETKCHYYDSKKINLLS